MRTLFSESTILSKQAENNKLLSETKSMLNDLKNNFFYKFKSELSKDYILTHEFYTNYINFNISYKININNIDYDFSFEFYIKNTHKSKSIEIHEGFFSCSAFDNLSNNDLEELLDVLQTLKNDFFSISHEEYADFIARYLNLHLCIENYEEKENKFQKKLLTIKHKDTVNKIYEVFPSLNDTNPIKNIEDLRNFINEHMKVTNQENHYIIGGWTYYFNGEKMLNQYSQFKIILSKEEPKNLEKANFYQHTRELKLDIFIAALNEAICFYNDKVINAKLIKEYIPDSNIELSELPKRLKPLFDKHEQYKLTGKLETF